MFQELMKPSIKWNNEYWCIEKHNNINEAMEKTKYATGRISNIILDLKEYKEGDESVFFNTYSWINKLMIIKDDKIQGVYKKRRKNEYRK